MPSVDNRVVEMRFDNKDFQSGVSESISSLNKLKRSLKLKDSADGFDEIGKAAESVTHKFSALGTIGDQILRNIGNEVYNLKNKFVDLVKSMSVDQVAAGWGKYGEKTSSVQTILNATGLSLEEVNGQLDRLMKYSDETSFGFTDMTAALQTMTASGGKLENLIPMLMGIGNATAYAGKTASEFSRVVYNLNQAYGLGYLGTMDWKSVQMAGVASKQLKQALLDSAKALGTGDYTLDQFQTALTKKAFTTEVMEDAFGKFAKVTLEAEKLWKSGLYDTFTEAYADLESKYLGTGDAYDELAYKAAKAAQEAKTFAEAIDATKDAVSTGWMTTFEILFGNYEEAKENWSWLAEELWEVFASGAEARNDMLQEWKDKGGFDLLWLGIRNLWNGLRAFGSRISEAWNKLFGNIDADKLYALTEKFVVFSGKVRAFLSPAAEALEEFADKSEKVKKRIVSIFGAGDIEVIENLNEDVSDLSDSADEYVNRLVNTLKVLPQLEQAIWSGEYGAGSNRREALEKEGYAWELVQDAINKTAGVTDVLLTDQEKLTLATKIFNGEIVGQSKKTKDAAEAIDKMADASKEAKTWISDLKDIANGLKDALWLVIEAAKLVGKYLLIPAWNKAVDIFKKLLGALAYVSRGFSEFIANVKASNIINTNLEIIRNWFADLYKYVKEKDNFKKLVEYISQFKSWTTGIKEKALEKIESFFETLSRLEIKLPPVETIGDWINTAIGWIDSLIDRLKQSDGLFQRIVDFFKNLDFSGVGQFAESIAHNVAQFLDKFITNGELRESARKSIVELYEGAKTALKQINWSGLFQMGIKVAMLVPLYRIGNAIRFFINGLTAKTKTPFTLISNLSSVLSNLTKTLKATALLEIAVSIGLITASIIALAKANIPIEKITSIAVALSAVILALAAIIKVLGGGRTKIGDTTVNNNLTNQNFSNNNATVQVINNLAATLIALGIAALSLAVAAKILDKTDVHGLYKLAGVVLGMILAVGLLMAALKLSAKGTEDQKAMAKDILIVALSMNLISMAIGLLVPAIAALAAISLIGDGAALQASIYSILGIIVAFSVLVLATKRQNTQKNDIIKAGLAFAVMAIAINLMVPAIAALTVLMALKPAATIGVMASLIILVGLFTVLFSLMGGMTQDKANKGVKAMLAIALVISTAAGVLYLLKGTSFKDLIVAVAGIAILVGAIAGLAAITTLVKGIDIVLDALGMAVGLIGIGFLAAGVGVLAFVTAIKMLSDGAINAKAAGKALAEGIIAFCDELSANGRSVLNVISWLINGIILIIAAKKANITEIGSDIIKALGTGLKNGIGKSKFVIIALLVVLIAGILDYLGLQVDVVVDALFKLVLLIINSLAKALIVNGEALFKAIFNVIKAIFFLIGQAIISMIDGIMELLGLDPKNNPLTNGLREFLNIDGLIDGIGTDIDKLHDGIKEDTDKLKETANILAKGTEEAAETIKGAQSNLQYFADPAVAQAMAATGTTNLDSVKLVSKQTSEGIMSGLLEGLTGGDVTPESIGTSVNEGLAGGILDNQDLSIDAAGLVGELTGQEMAKKLEVNSPSKLTDRFGKYMDQGLANGMAHNTSLIRAAIKTISDVINNEFELINQRMKDLGKNTVQGYVNGIDTNLYLVVAESRKMGHIAIKSTAESIDSHSPAKEFGKLGKYSAQGYANELANNIYLAEDAATALGEDTLSAFNSVIQRIYNAINGDFDMNPVIRPVLDLSEIQNGQGRLASVLSGNGYGFSPNMQYSMIHANNVMASFNSDNLAMEVRALREEVRQFKMDQSGRDLSSAVRGIRDDIGGFNEKLGQMRVVLDDGTLVGHIDSALGQRTRLARRGV